MTEELRVGRAFTYRRTFTEGDASTFCGVTGDFNPYHQDAVFTAGTRFGRPILPGLLVGSMITHIGGMLGFLSSEMSFEFLAPVYPGDTVTCTVTVTEQDERGRFVMQASLVDVDGVEVQRARFFGRPTEVRLAR